jgi:hypothetical protein
LSGPNDNDISLRVLEQWFEINRRLTLPAPRAKLKFVKLPLIFSAILLFMVALAGMVPAESYAAQATISPSIIIVSPREGQALQGIEIIEGKIRGDGLKGGKISFRYAGEGQETWFFITDVEPTGEESSQATFKVEWDTNGITDGNYHLRVVGEYEGGARIFEGVQNLRIRNQSPVETSTPLPNATWDPASAAPTRTMPSTLLPSPTPLPDNPVEIKTGDLVRVLMGSGIVILVAFLIGGIYSLSKRGFRRE